ncbi:efflux RND transporter permease subunit [Arthrobacter sp. ISL-30]|uniref:efflux RND transporter permease subunit n=1 Tax=Arthrobacter sp. ISL-30 TaxID=2819109 RepID=UPI001BE9B8A7|nr:efflux RND transporter permease subunit [Arthrobacter sp. ISL-30]MBT2512745.1 efflux RND transporter permease subunit [Arthrobacter sp. ISL-30]
MFGAFARLSLQFRILVLALAAGIIAFGIINVPRMAVDGLPEFAPAHVEIQTEALGLSALEVEQLITVPMEADLLHGVAWLEEIRSKSVPGLSSIELVFRPGTDLMRARQLVAERMTQAHALPNVSSPPLIMQPLSSTSRLLMVRMSSKELSGIDMSVLARWKIKPRLLGVQGVANVSIWGQREQQLQVEVNPNTLRDKGLTLEQIVKSTGNAVWVSPLSFLEASTPGTGGFIESNNQRLGIQHVLPISTPQELAQVHVEESDPSVKLGDVATVKEDHQPLIGDAVIGQDPGLLLVIEKFPNANTLQVTKDVEAALKDLEPGLTGVELDTSIYRPASALQETVDRLGLALLVSLIVLVALFWLLFRSWRAALVAFVSLTTSVTAAVLVLELQGATLNVTVLVGILLAVTLIVGDMVEDVNAQLRGSPGPIGAQQNGDFRSFVAATVRWVRTPLLLASLTLVLVMVPVLFDAGISVNFFSPLVWAMALALLAAFAVGISVTPVMAHLLLKRDALRQPPSSRYENVRRYYGQTLDRGRRMLPIGVAAVAVVGLAGLLAASQLTGNRAVVPTLPDRTLLVQWDAMAGTSTSEVSRIAARAADELRTISGVTRVGGHVGRAITSDQVVGNSSAELWVTVAQNADYSRVESAVREIVNGYPGIAHNVLNYSQQQIGEIRSGMEPGFAVRVYGTEMTVLREKAEEVRKALTGIQGLNSPQIKSTPQLPVLEVEVDLAAAQKAGIKPGDARRAAATLVQGIVVGNLFEQQKVFEVVVRGTFDVRDDLTSVRELLLDTPTGGHVRLGEIATVRLVPNETVITHSSTFRHIDIVADVSGRPLGDVERDIQAAIKTVQFPVEYHAEIPTKYADLQNADLLVMGIGVTALLGVLILLQTAVRNWKTALAVFLGLPAALSGGFLAAFLAGHSVSWISLTALAVLLAITVRNTAVFAAICDRGWREHPGTSRAKVVMAAAKERIAPVLKAAAITAVVLIPIALLGGAAGSGVVAPMALIIVCGLVTTTLFALLVVPLVLLWFGPEHGPEDWEAISRMDVPATQEKVEVK